MSFFRGLKRLVMGEPIFKESDTTPLKPPKVTKEGISAPPQSFQTAPTHEMPTAPHAESTIRKGDASTFPVVYVKRTTTHINGPNMQIYCIIVNGSQGEVELDKIHFLGRIRELDHFLRAHEEHEFEVYNGPRSTTKPDDEAQLDYKTHEGDYFRSIHDVTFDVDASNTYVVDELKLRLPILDIYE
jgi:hypothetical protein